MNDHEVAEESRPVDVRPQPMVAWERLLRGNERFVAGAPEHPGQDAAKRAEVSSGQRPYAMIFGCSDSRVAAEIVFDQGLGDLFVVRTAGHVVDSAVLGSCEFGVSALGISLIVVLGHDSCGAVASTVEALDRGEMPSGFLRDIVERVSPSVVAARHEARPEEPSVEAVEQEHVRQTVGLLTGRSAVLDAAVRSGQCAVVGATYQLGAGRVSPVS